MESRPDFESAWDDLANKVADDLGLADDDTLPTPANVAGALGEDWMAGAREKYRRRFSDLYDLVKKGFPEDRADLFPQSDPLVDPPIRWHKLGMDSDMRIEGLPVSGVLINTDGEIDRRLSNGLQTLNLVVLFVGPKAILHPVGAGDDQPMWTVDNLIYGFEAVHMIWQTAAPAQRAGLEHPLAPLIEGWMDDQPVEPDKREMVIMPNTTRVSSITVLHADDGALFDLDAWAPTTDNIGAQDQAVLPGLEPGPSLIQALPLYLYDGTGAPIYQGGGGAALPLRIWVEVVTSVRIEDRERGRSVPIPFTLREMIAGQWPDGWQRNNQMPRLRRGMADVDQLRFTVKLPGGGRTSWRAVGWTGIFPHDARLDDVAIAHVVLPPGSSHGPKIHKPTLRRLGVKSAAQYRAALGMAYHWWDRAIKGRYILPYRKQLLRDRYGNPAKVDGGAILDDSGRPIQQLMIGSGKKRRPHPDLAWIDDQGNLAPFEHAAQEKNPAAWGLEDKKGYPIIRGDDLIRLFNPKVKKGTQRRKQLSYARQDLEAMAKEVLCVIETVDGGYRVMPPPWW